MRHYPSDSPQAMARILALAMIVDGGLDRSELEIISRHQMLTKLGLDETEFSTILHHVCEDMLQCLHNPNFGQIELDYAALDGIFAEIQDQELRLLLLRWMVAIVDADQRISEGEAIFMSRALSCWIDDALYEEAAYSSATSLYRPPITTVAAQPG